MQAYQNADRNAAAESEDPHALVALLFEELLRHMRPHVPQQFLEKKGNKSVRIFRFGSSIAISILIGLHHLSACHFIWLSMKTGRHLRTR